MIKVNKGPFTPHWFKYIDTKNQTKFTLFDNSIYKLYINHPPFNSKIKIAYFLDGIFYPTTTGMAYHIMNLLNALTNAGIDTYLFRCYRGWEEPNVYKKFKFNTICIEPSVFYDNLKQVNELLVSNNINVVILDTSEVVLLQGSYFKKHLTIKLVQDVPNVDPIISKMAGLKGTVVKQQEKEILGAEKLVDIYWSKTKEDSLELVNLGVTSSKIKTCGVGIDIQAFKYRRRDSLTQPIKAIYLGNMYYPPNIGGLIKLEKTCLRCIEKNVILNIDVVGDGDIPYLSQKYPHLHFVGKKKDLMCLLDKYELALACPSYGSGISLKILDYLASGIPTVSNDIGIRGHMDEIKTSVLVDNNEELSSSIIKLLSDAKMYKNISSLGRSYVKKYFNINKNVSLFINDLFDK
jgi:glycosyltransferase involved in cell wall biosynthesis